ncbi:hypothetical protein GWK47_018186 [Chionoecetes opilio]|uniref:Uncharacterized protein n=1 Tax=Chionoecetes opilio TaxID=41210 RepID=A0A8J4XVB8_CHIOP|nr:hypothetical protein GWK47_018186 [Chionoecetes opilio]
MTSHDVELLPGTSPLRQPPYRLHPRKCEPDDAICGLSTPAGLAIPQHSAVGVTMSSRQPKEDGQLAPLHGLPPRVNAVTVFRRLPALPRIDDLIDKGYYRRFPVPTSRPLPSLSPGSLVGCDYNWTDSAKPPFNQLKNFLSQGPVLIGPDFAKPLRLQPIQRHRL